MKTASAALLILVLRVAPVWAVLGQYESSVSLDERALHGADRQEAHPGYRLHQITASDGSVVREYVSPAGLVFGVAWQSPRMPNLTQLLGSSITELQVTLQSRTPGIPSRAPLIVQTPKLVFLSGGHLRSFHGYAYVPGLVPAGVSPEVVQ
jgi:hypothetical protein